MKNENSYDPVSYWGVVESDTMSHIGVDTMCLWSLTVIHRINKSFQFVLVFFFSFFLEPNGRALFVFFPWSNYKLIFIKMNVRFDKGSGYFCIFN